MNLVQRAEIPDDAVASAGIRCADQKYESVEGMAVVQRPYLALLLGAARANPRSRG